MADRSSKSPKDKKVPSPKPPTPGVAAGLQGAFSALAGPVVQIPSKLEVSPPRQGAAGSDKSPVKLPAPGSPRKPPLSPAKKLLGTVAGYAKKGKDDLSHKLFDSKSTSSSSSKGPYPSKKAKDVDPSKVRSSSEYEKAPSTTSSLSLASNATERSTLEEDVFEK